MFHLSLTGRTDLEVTKEEADWTAVTDAFVFLFILTPVTAEFIFCTFQYFLLSSFSLSFIPRVFSFTLKLFPPLVFHKKIYSIIITIIIIMFPSNKRKRRETLNSI